MYLYFGFSLNVRVHLKTVTVTHRTQVTFRSLTKESNTGEETSVKGEVHVLRVDQVY